MTISNSIKYSLSFSEKITEKTDNHISKLTPTDWLVLSFIKGVGPARLDRLKLYLDETQRLASEHTEANDSSLAISESLLIKLKWPEHTAKEAAGYLLQGVMTGLVQSKFEDTQKWLQEDNHYLISKDDDCYPELLKQIPVAPMLIYLVGNPNTLSQPKLGIVGARKCSAYGRDNAFYFSKALANEGLTIVSGGALGVDTSAHMGALSANASTVAPTIAVMGSGLMNLYPKINLGLYENLIDQGGAIISEYPLSTPVKAHLFPPRNRIISGLSMGVFVVEAAKKSGSLISAHYAIQHNREVFALPGRIYDEQALGTLGLIQQGAKLVTCVEDILIELPNFKRNRVELDSTQFDLNSAIKQKNDTDNQNVSREIDSDFNQIASRRDKNIITPAGFSPFTATTSITTTKTTASAIGIKITDEKLNDKLVLVPWNEATLNQSSLHVISHIDDVLKKDEGNNRKIFEFDELVEALSNTASTLSQALMELELLGLIESFSTGHIRCYTTE